MVGHIEMVNLVKYNGAGVLHYFCIKGYRWSYTWFVLKIQQHCSSTFRVLYIGPYRDQLALIVAATSITASASSTKP